MININETSENSKIYIQRNITNAELVKNNYVTEDELTNTLKKYTTIEDLSRALAQTRIPFVIITSLPNGSAYVVNGDLNNVILAVNQHCPYLAYFHNTSGRVYGQIGIHKLTFCSFRTDRNGIISYYDFSMDGGEVYVEINYLYDVNSHNYVLGKINANRKSYLTSIPEEYVTDSELTKKGYATEQWVEDKGYLKDIPEEYITETELNEALANIGGGIPYLWVTYNETDGYKYIGSFTDIIDAIGSQKPFIVYVPSGIHNYYTTLELVEYNQNMINGVGYAHTYDTNYFTQWMLYKDSTQNKRLNHINEYAEKSYVDEQLGNINNLLENIIE